MVSGAPISMVILRLANTLNVPRIADCQTDILGVGRQLSSSYQGKLTLNSVHSDQPPMNVCAYVMHSISLTSIGLGMAPARELTFIKGLYLADPNFCPSCTIDLLLSFTYCNQCTRSRVVFSTNRGFKAEQKIFGWAVGTQKRGL